MQPKILVVDDTPANLVAMRRLLARVDSQVFEASSGNQALTLCLDHQFALILLDVNMPDMDGFEVAALLGDNDQAHDTPIIFVTAAYADDINRLKGYRFGAVDYISKPINDVILQSKVRVFLDLYRARAMLQSALNELADRNTQLMLEIAERKRIEEQVRYQATHDMLTGLPNRTLFHDRLRTAITRAERHQTRFALACIDIDGFKGVNDSHGHPAGDAQLQAIATRLKNDMRGNDTVARLGGDEFALIMEDLADEQSALTRCEALCVTLGEPYLLTVGQDPVATRVGASIGIALSSKNGTPNAELRLIQAADNALYEAKRAGKNQCVMAASVN
jgi:diguanylate cyclase (GGDEF)-like protein